MNHKLKLLILFFTLSSWITTHQSPAIKPGIIILLNGTSSAGKSTLVAALHNIYPTFTVADIDTYSRIHQQKKHSEFYKEIKEKSLAGKNILVDTILYHEKYKAYDALLTESTQLIKILVYCPLDTLIAHVVQRNQTNNSLEHRSVSRAFAAFASLYTMQNSKSSLAIDIFHSSTMHDALEKSLDMIQTWSSKHRKRQHKINQTLIKQFNLTKPHEIILYPQHQWDLIVNTSLDTPDNITRSIADFIESKFPTPLQDKQDTFK